MGIATAIGTIRNDQMIDRDMVLACVLARVQANNKELKDLSQHEIDVLVREAIEELQFADQINGEKSNELV